jgi:hypothetical protein
MGFSIKVGVGLGILSSQRAINESGFKNKFLSRRRGWVKYLKSLNVRVLVKDLYDLIYNKINPST